MDLACWRDFGLSAVLLAMHFICGVVGYAACILFVIGLRTIGDAQRHLLQAFISRHLVNAV